MYGKILWSARASLGLHSWGCILGVAFLALSPGVLTGFYEATDPIGVPTALLFFLRGDWKGHRSSRLNQQYRVIYCTKGDRLLVEVVEVNPHDYPKKS